MALVLGGHLSLQSASLWVQSSLCGGRTNASLYTQVQPQQKLRLHVCRRYPAKGKYIYFILKADTKVTSIVCAGSSKMTENV